MENPLEFYQFYLQHEKSENWELTTAPKGGIDIYGRPLRNGEGCLLKVEPHSHQCISQASAERWLHDLKQDPQTFASLKEKFEKKKKIAGPS